MPPVSLRVKPFHLSVRNLKGSRVYSTLPMGGVPDRPDVSLKLVPGLWDSWVDPWTFLINGSRVSQIRVSQVREPGRSRGSSSELRFLMPQSLAKESAV